MRSFLKGPVTNGEYGAAVTNKWIPGHNPDLVLYDNADNKVKTIDVSGMKFKQLHELVVSYGFAKVGSSAASDQKQEVDAPRKDATSGFTKGDFFDAEDEPAKPVKPQSGAGLSSRHARDVYLPGLVSTSGVSRPQGHLLRGSTSEVQPQSTHREERESTL